MRTLTRPDIFALLNEIETLRIAAFDHERHAMYAVPLRFAVEGEEVLIAIQQGSRLDHVISRQHRGLCIEADDIRPDWTFRSVIGTATAHTIHDPTQTLIALASRYGARWGTWRPNPVQAYRLHFTELHGRDTTGTRQ